MISVAQGSSSPALSGRPLKVQVRQNGDSVVAGLFGVSQRLLDGLHQIVDGAGESLDESSRDSLRSGFHRNRRSFDEYPAAADAHAGIDVQQSYAFAVDGKLNL